MQKMYPCIFITQDEIRAVYQGRNAVFQNTYLTTPSLYGTLENYLGIPIISIRPDPRTDDTILVFYADGYIQQNPKSGKRLAVINGTYEYIIQAIKDIVDERRVIAPKLHPTAITNLYTFNPAAISDRMLINRWIKQTYGTPE